MEELRNKINEANKTLKCRYGNILKGKKPGNKYYDLLNEINAATSHLPIDTGISTRIYYIFNGTIEHPKCLCGCGNPVNKLNDKYLPHHHEKHSENKKKQVSTFFKNHGGKGTEAYQKVQDKKDATSIARFETLENKKKHVAEKAKATCMEKWNVENAFQRQDVKDATVARWQDPEQKEAILAKRKATRNINFYNKLKATGRLKNIVTPLFDTYNGVNNLYKFKCTVCSHEFDSNLDDGKVPRCIICNPLINTKGQSLAENEVAEYIKSIYNGQMIIQTRKIIAPLELDITLPDKKIAIEFCGLYWHSELGCGKDRNYHLNKLNRCTEAGYRLITIFEDEWEYKQDIVKARLKHILGTVKQSIYARNCIVKPIDNDIANNFIDKYHLQGSTHGKINLGLFYKNRLVSVMTFDKPRFNNMFEFEILRYCSVFHFNIVGGAGKLFQHFVNNYKPSSVITYADRRWSNGELYTKLGFNPAGNSDPSYFYLRNENHMVRYNRLKFQKHKLKDLLENFDESMSEWQNMQNNNYDRIFDCGNAVFTYGVN